MKKIYIAGPMTGYVGFNYPAFHAQAARLTAAGWKVENPAENPVPACGSWKGYMRAAIRQLATCDAIVMLPGWSASCGATIEHGIAVALELEFVEFAQ